jgi:hypothetical protein
LSSAAHVELHEALALLIGDLQAAVDRDEVVEAELAWEPIRASERLGREPNQVVDVGGPTLAEQRLQQRVRQDAVVEDLLEAVKGLLTAGVLE